MRVTTTYESVINMYALEERCFLDNSLLMFCSDHGKWLGEYWVSHKWLMYDPIVHVPLIVRAGCKSRAGEEVDNLVSLMDMEPNDLGRDPHELWNLCDSSEHRQLPTDLLTDSLRWLTSSNHYNNGDRRQYSRHYGMYSLIPDNAFLPRC